MQFLICTDGTPVGENALNFGLTLARRAQAETTLLGVYEAPQREAAVRDAVDRAQASLPGVAVSLHRGRLAPEVLAQAQRHGYDLIVVGSRGRRGLERLAFGSVAARLARYAPASVLIVKGSPRPAVRRVLVCTTGDQRGERVARWGGHIAHWTGADVTVLHVMSQIPISAEARDDELSGTAEEAVARGTREGQHLRRELEVLQTQAGETPLALHARLRYGLVVEEVAAETEEGDYDLVILGAHKPPEAPVDWDGLDFLLEDVTDQIIMAVHRPVLVVKGS